MISAPQSRSSEQSGGLQRLEEAIRRDLSLLAYPARPWVPPRRTRAGAPILDVLVVGGGQSGLTAAFGLMCERISNLLVVDEGEAGLAGPWRTYARMVTLRTPKHLTGPDHGIPNLTFRAWFEAQHGSEAWEALGKIPKEQWADYLAWYQRVLGIPVRHRTRVGTLQWSEEERCFEVPVVQDGDGGRLWARKVVLATGIDGSGRWEVPENVKRLPRDRYSHTRDDIDFERLRGRRIGVLGAGASAFDNAIAALDHGATEVHLFYRRKRLPNVNLYRWAEFVGFLKHHADLPDAERWRFVRKLLEVGQLPPGETYARARSQPGFHLHGDSPWTGVEPEGPGARVSTPHGTFPFDHLIIGSGFITDLSLRPELAQLHPRIALWRHRYTPPAGEEHEDLLRHPYLGPNFEFQELEPGEAPYVSSVFNYTFGCLLSVGFGGASISGMKYSLPRLVAGVTCQLYVEDAAEHYRSLEAFDLAEYPL